LAGTARPSIAAVELNAPFPAQVFRLASSCVSDTELSPEEKQIFEELSRVKPDAHADAHACKLKLSLVTADSTMVCPWDVDVELGAYVRKLRSVPWPGGASSTTR
jgi:hypothetical protein